MYYISIASLFKVLLRAFCLRLSNGVGVLHLCLNRDKEIISTLLDYKLGYDKVARKGYVVSRLV